MTHAGRVIRIFSKFQSTPPLKAVTVFVHSFQEFIVISIHTAPKGGDNVVSWLPETLRISIHTAPKGGDDGQGICADCLAISIHTAPKGGDCSL